MFDAIEMDLFGPEAPGTTRNRSRAEDFGTGGVGAGGLCERNAPRKTVQTENRLSMGCPAHAYDSGGEGGAVSTSGTSIFDPVLTELVYRWFCPPGGAILDPFAGGSVRGVVAAALGYRYTGVDLRPEQLTANRAQAAAILGPGAVPPIHVERIEGVDVVRDDLVPGGTKRRALERMIQLWPEAELVYASPACGYAQLALALAGAGNDRRVTIFTAARGTLAPLTAAAQAAGARIEQVPAGYLSNVQAKARAYCAETGARLVPFGLDCPEFVDALAGIVQDAAIDAPDEVWTAAGSGVLSRALQRAWPAARFFAVAVGKEPDAGRATVIRAPEPFDATATEAPPFPSSENYDAKAWRFVREAVRWSGRRVLFWNVAGPAAQASAPLGPSPRWLCGDSVDVQTLAPGEYDLVFSCPPYADLERYSDDPRDLSTMDYPAFVDAYRRIIAASCAMLKPDRFAAFVVGDVRGKDGLYRGLPWDTVAAFRAAGLGLYNEAVLVTQVGSLPIRVTKQFESGRKLGKTHQNLLVFVKGDWRRAAAAANGGGGR